MAFLARKRMRVAGVVYNAREPIPFDSLDAKLRSQLLDQRRVTLVPDMPEEIQPKQDSEGKPRPKLKLKEK